MGEERTKSASRVSEYSTEVRELPRLFLASECCRPFASAIRFDLTGCDDVAIGRGSERAWRRDGKALQIRIADDEVSRHHLSIQHSDDGWELRDVGSKNGTAINGVTVTSTMLADGDVVEVGGAIFVFRDDGSVPGSFSDLDLEPMVATPMAFRTLNLEIEACFADLRRVAPTKVAILIGGQTGTGKELTARAIHQLSGRQGAFVAVNCGALPRTLVESDLFGSKRGSFSGAREDREGLVRRAHGGTLFLDEMLSCQRSRRSRYCACCKTARFVRLDRQKLYM